MNPKKAMMKRVLETLAEVHRGMQAAEAAGLRIINVSIDYYDKPVMQLDAESYLAVVGKTALVDYNDRFQKMHTEIDGLTVLALFEREDD